MSLDATKCPQCGSRVEHGFGLMGGGYGPYIYCTGEFEDDANDCDWFYKEQDTSEDSHIPQEGEK